MLARALELHRAGRLDEAAAIYEQLLAHDPEHADAAHLLGLVRFRRGDFDAAVGLIRDAIARDAQNPIYQGNLGNVLKDAGRPDEAIAAYRRALEIHPEYAEIHNNLGYVLQSSGRLADALAHYRRAIALRPDNPRAHYNLGNALFLDGRSEEAISAFREAVKLKPDFAEAWDRLGTALVASAERMEQAFQAYRHASELRPDLLPATASALWLAQRMCDWNAVPRYSDAVLTRAAEEPQAVSPFQLMSLPAATRVNLLAHARALSATIAPKETTRHDTARFAERSRVRVGYLSSDFHGHPVAYLVAEVVELHDRQRFEVLLFSYGPDDGSAMRRRLESHGDRFIDLRSMSDQAAAQRIRGEGVQILVDLKGYTADDRPGIAALRPAPIQVNWLGFPGTMGAEWIDYIVADRTIVPPEHDVDYTEKVVRLPHCYQPNDRQRPVGDAGLTRSGCGLPESGFVFACFNQSYKIEPRVFAIWMRILEAVPGSVLWLLEENAPAVRNLRQAAEDRGTAPERVVFAPIRPLAEHLARYALADLVLDTFPYTSHTTGSDALWAGCPMVTMLGETFASRVAASLLVNVGLDELIAKSFGQYESLALELARDRPRLSALRGHLRERRATLPLFDSPRFTRGLEAAYARMWSRFAEGKPPEPLALADD